MKTPLFIIPVVFCLGCASAGEEERFTAGGNARDHWEGIQAVEVFRLEPGVFNDELISWGKVRSSGRVEILNHIGGFIEEIRVMNGDRVSAGDTLVRLKNTELELALRKARDDYRLAEIEMHSLLLGVGSDGADSAGIPSSIYENLRVQSGLNRAEILVDQAECHTGLLTITAPVAGIVYNLKLTPRNWQDKGGKVCDIVGSGEYYVDFRIFEEDISRFCTGLEIVAEMPLFDGGRWKGIITHITPLVDISGTIEATARLSGTPDVLPDGLRVRVVALLSSGDRMVIPKSALVSRARQDVVFTYANGRAIWNQVVVGSENRESYLILDGLKFGDSVIKSGNIGLLNNSEVTVSRNIAGGRL